MLRLLLAWFLFPFVFGGSPCPSREKLYPCICLDRRIGKSKFDTIVICQGLSKEPSISDMEINTFLMYDSYWPTDNKLLRAQARIPVNHVSKLKIEEVKIVDTTLSNFGCPTPDNCVTNYVKKFIAINTTAANTERCNNNGLAINIWISCPGNIEEVTINKGFTSEALLKPDFFPEPMNKLRILRLPNNNIQRIDRTAFIISKFPVLRTLDLSHNLITDSKIFSTTLKVEDLDLSHNLLRGVADFSKLPNLKILKLNDNHIVSLLENEWRSSVPASLITIDLTNNKIVCDCSMKWLNSSLPIHTAVLGSCKSPAETANKKLRRASRLLVLRCKDGNIMASKQHNN